MLGFCNQVAKNHAKRLHIYQTCIRNLHFSEPRGRRIQGEQVTSTVIVSSTLHKQRKKVEANLAKTTMNAELDVELYNIHRLFAYKLENDLERIQFKDFRDKILLFVNTASKCKLAEKNF